MSKAYYTASAVGGHAHRGEEAGRVRPGLGLPAGQIAIADFHGAELLGPSAAELQSRLQTAPGWDERFRLARLRSPRSRGEPLVFGTYRGEPRGSD